MTTPIKILSEDIGSIYHCATSMNHLETYTMAKPTNVEGSRELLKLATYKRLKVINYLSTLGVFSSWGGDALASWKKRARSTTKSI